jgi:hypothetical protein
MHSIVELRDHSIAQFYVSRDWQPSQLFNHFESEVSIPQLENV